jgi:hypothetical protein
MRNGEDGVISKLMKQVLHLKLGIVKGIKCFHACGPYYSKQYGYLARDIKKYKESRLEKFVQIYESYN